MTFDLREILDSARAKRPAKPERNTLKALVKENLDVIRDARSAGDRWEDIAEVWSKAIKRSMNPRTLSQYYSELSTGQNLSAEHTQR